MQLGDKLDYYCFTVGNDGETWTYLSVYERGFAGWVLDVYLPGLAEADAKRLVDFAAGLAFALRGSFDKVATKVFLLSPADIDVSAEERRRIAEAGFYAYQ